MAKKIVIAGSYSVGLFFNGGRIPKVGETVTASTYFETFGGKGSNQAVAAAKLGADAKFICKLGTDRYGEEAIAMYEQVGLFGPGILRDAETGTSVGVIIVDESGNNAISIYLGANEKLTSDEVISFIRAQKQVDLVGFQLENDPDMVVRCIETCAQMGLEVLLDPAPVAPLPMSVYPHLTYIKPNEHEAAALSGIAVNTVQDAFRAGHWFLDAGVKNAIITLGEQGTVCVTAGKEQYFPPIKVDTVDTTGAGDVFSGAFMRALAGDMPLEDAIVYANCAASLSVTKPGVTEAVPTVEEVEKLYSARKGTII